MIQIPDHLDGAISFTGCEPGGRSEKKKGSRFTFRLLLQSGKEENRVTALSEVEVILTGGRSLRRSGPGFSVETGSADGVVLVTRRRGEVLVFFSEGDEVNVSLQFRHMDDPNPGRSARGKGGFAEGRGDFAITVGGVEVLQLSVEQSFVKSLGQHEESLGGFLLNTTQKWGNLDEDG